MDSRSVRSGKATDLDLVAFEVFSVGSAGCSGTGAVLQTVDLDGACCASLLDRPLYHACVGCGGLWRGSGYWSGDCQKREESDDGGECELHIEY